MRTILVIIPLMILLTSNAFAGTSSGGVSYVPEDEMGFLNPDLLINLTPEKLSEIRELIRSGKLKIKSPSGIERFELVEELPSSLHLESIDSPKSATIDSVDSVQLESSGIIEYSNSDLTIELD
jgi:hypothetical protein